MIYIVLSIVILVVAIAFGASFRMYILDKRRKHSAHAHDRKPARDIPLYELSSWIDDEIAARKLYRKPDLSAAELADELGISEKRLKYTISKAYNKNVKDYLNDRRIQAACRLLREQTEKTMDEISLEAGFASLKTFQTIFRNTMGQSPEQYRKMSKNIKITPGDKRNVET